MLRTRIRRINADKKRKSVFIRLIRSIRVVLMVDSYLRSIT